MKAWQDISLQLQRQNVVLGQTLNIQGILQDSYTSEFLIVIEGVIATAAATAAIEGLTAILQKINISGPLPGYQPLTPVNGLSGPMVTEIGQFIRKNLSFSFGGLGTTGKFGCTIPCTFINPRMKYPLSHMAILPTNIMGAVNFSVQVATQAQLDTNGTATLAFTSINIYVQQNEYKANSIPALAPLIPAPNAGLFKFVPSSLNYVQNQNVQASQQSQQLFPNGTYMLILIRSFPTTVGGVASSRQSDTAVTGPFDTSITSQGIVIQDVNQAPKSAEDWYSLRKKNLDTIDDPLVTGNVCFQYNQGADKIFQPIIGPNQIPLNYATVLTSTTAPRIDFVYQQIFDTMNWLGLV